MFIKHIPPEDYDVPNVPEGMMPEILSQSTFEEGDFRIYRFHSFTGWTQWGCWSTKNIQGVSKDADEEQQQRGPESGSKLEPRLVITEKKKKKKDIQWKDIASIWLNDLWTYQPPRARSYRDGFSASTWESRI